MIDDIIKQIKEIVGEDNEILCIVGNPKENAMSFLITQNEVKLCNLLTGAALEDNSLKTAVLASAILLEKRVQDEIDKAFKELEEQPIPVISNKGQKPS